MGGIAGSLEGSASFVKEPQVAAPAPSVPATSVPAGGDAASSKMLDVGASKQQALAGNAANREAQPMGQMSGSLAGNAGENGVSASVQGSSSATASWQRPVSQPTQ
jgi:hypothetical protein